MASSYSRCGVFEGEFVVMAGSVPVPAAIDATALEMSLQLARERLASTSNAAPSLQTPAAVTLPASQ
jgi:hypothetical protein